MCQTDHRREETRRIINMGEEEDMVCSKTTSPLRDARGDPIEADYRGDLRNVPRSHRGRVLREVEAKRAEEGTNSKSST